MNFFNVYNFVKPKTFQSGSVPCNPVKRHVMCFSATAATTITFRLYATSLCAHLMLHVPLYLLGLEFFASIFGLG